MTQVDLAAMTHWGYVGAFAGGIAITFVAGFASRRRARALTDRSIEGLAAAYANAGYMGIPLCVALFGAESLAPAVLRHAADGQRPVRLRHRPDRAGPPAGARPGRHPAQGRPGADAQPAAGRARGRPGLGRHRHRAARRAGPLRDAAGRLGQPLCAGGHRPVPGADRASPGPGVLRLVLGKLLLQPAATAALAFLVFDMPPLWAWTAVLMSALPIGTGPSCWRACTGATPA